MDVNAQGTLARWLLCTPQVHPSFACDPASLRLPQSNTCLLTGAHASRWQLLCRIHNAEKRDLPPQRSSGQNWEALKPVHRWSSRTQEVARRSDSQRCSSFRASNAHVSRARNIILPISPPCAPPPPPKLIIDGPRSCLKRPAD